MPSNSTYTQEDALRDLDVLASLNEGTDEGYSVSNEDWIDASPYRDRLRAYIESTDERVMEFENACEAQGLPRSCSVERFVQHHRGNAAFAQALEMIDTDERYRKVVEAAEEMRNEVQHCAAGYDRYDALTNAAQRFDAALKEVRP